MPSSPSRMSQPLLLLLATSILLSLWILWKVRQVMQETPTTTPNPGPCLHWAGIRGDVLRPTVHCIHRQGVSATTRAQWQKQLRNASPRCQLSGTLPRPKHGQAVWLHGSAGKCRWSIRWLSAPTRVQLGIRLYLNACSVKELRAVPRMSRKVAQRIVAYRKKTGNFKTWEELGQIRGIGRKTLFRFKTYLRLDAPPASIQSRYPPPTRRHPVRSRVVAPSVQ